MATITYCAWDMTSGSDGDTGVDVSTNGNTTAFSTAFQAASVTVIAINDAPVVTVPRAQSVDEDTNLVITGISVADVDAGSSGIVTATLSVGLNRGTLTVNTTVSGGLGAGVISGNGTANVTLTGTLAQINATLANASGLTYRGALNVNGSDTLTVTATDNGLTGLGGAKSGTKTVSITVNPVNDAPVLTLTTTPLSYVGNSGNPTVTIDNSTTANVTDVDSIDFDTGTLTVQFQSGGDVDDRLGIRSGFNGIAVSGSTITFNGNTIGTFTGGTNGSTPLVITFTTSATPTAARALIRNITYQNVNSNPADGTRVMQFVLTDGDGGTDNSATRSINVQ
jgi:hypothetical protein